MGLYCSFDDSLLFAVLAHKDICSMILFDRGKQRRGFPTTPFAAGRWLQSL